MLVFTFMSTFALPLYLHHIIATVPECQLEGEVGAWSSPVLLAQLSGRESQHSSLGVMDAMGGLRQLGAFVRQVPTSPPTSALHFVWRVRVLNNSGLPLKLAQLGAAGSTEIALPVATRGSTDLAADAVPWFWSDGEVGQEHHEEHEHEQRLCLSVKVAGTDCEWSQVRGRVVARVSRRQL